MLLGHVADHVEALAIGQADVEKDEVEVVFSEVFFGGGEGADRRNVVTASPEMLLKALAGDQFIFQDNNFFDGHLS
ncbi:hypothetical protein SDC9_198193 [bioreactor metagenome]|uniref:Uncharacterized protein n=1 Tax=bioreactor metagenome TaxID=1076179 RepID=A0A645IHU9_9ZZZZ